MDIKENAVKNEISPPKTAKCMDVIRIIVGIFTIIMSFSALIDGIKLGSQGFPVYAVAMIACFALLFIGGIVMIVCYKNHTLGVSIEDRRLTDEKTRNAFNEILATDFDEGTPYTLTHDADDPLKWHIVVLGFEDCPVGTDYSIYGICRIGSRWAVIFRNEIGESEDGNSPTVYHELDPKYNEVFDKFINW